MSIYYIGVDVGTASVRAGLVRKDGVLVCHSNRAIEICHYENDFYEQSSLEVWEKVCQVVKVHKNNEISLSE